MKTIDKEVALISAYIVSQDLLNGTFFSTYDKALEIAQQFLYRYPSDTKWGENNLEWDETVEKFVNDNYII